MKASGERETAGKENGVGSTLVATLLVLRAGFAFDYCIDECDIQEEQLFWSFAEWVPL